MIENGFVGVAVGNIDDHDGRRHRHLHRVFHRREERVARKDIGWNRDFDAGALGGHRDVRENKIRRTECA
ncbi:hypothetical protein FNZ07_09860 [Paraburkholderia megapolitana]|nr:hypothetical protein FNZ07_09860 [Paraburkholderia megapolitana]